MTDTYKKHSLQSHIFQCGTKKSKYIFRQEMYCAKIYQRGTHAIRRWVAFCFIFRCLNAFLYCVAGPFGLFGSIGMSGEKGRA